MLPMQDKSWVVGEFVQDLTTIRDNQLYIVLTLNEGIVFKKVKNELQKKGSLMMISTNPEYDPYDLPVVEIREVWKFVLYITGEVPESNDNSRIWNHLDEIKKDIGEIKSRIGK
jgi:hypothetical protein